MEKKTVQDNTIFLTVAGSKAYGTSTPESDTDVRGICIIPDKTQYFGYGLSKFGQMDSGWEDDRVIYDIRKFIALAADCNPNVIELLFTPEKFHIICNQYMQILLDNKDEFLSKKARFTFMGYAFSQLKRIKTHRSYLLAPPKTKPERKGFGLPDRKLISADNMGAFQWLIAKFLQNSVEELNISDSTREELFGLNYIGMVQKNIPTDALGEIQNLTGATDEWMHTIAKEKAYQHALDDWNAYQNWKSSRNPKRAELEAKYGYDCKHAMHLVRLIRMGVEVLRDQKVIVERPDSEELFSIRNGAWPFEKITEYVEEQEKVLASLYDTSSLRKAVNRTKIEEVCSDIVEIYLRDKGKL